MRAAWGVKRMENIALLIAHTGVSNKWKVAKYSIYTSNVL